MISLELYQIIREKFIKYSLPTIQYVTSIEERTQQCLCQLKEQLHALDQELNKLIHTYTCGLQGRGQINLSRNFRTIDQLATVAHSSAHILAGAGIIPHQIHLYLESLYGRGLQSITTQIHGHGRIKTH